MINEKYSFSSNLGFGCYFLRMTIESLKTTIVLCEKKTHNTNNFKLLNSYYRQQILTVFRVLLCNIILNHLHIPSIKFF